tara:strand:- start:475 stop:912 length:438 start_codon:yes stop_codon:yes gene_type:complete
MRNIFIVLLFLTTITNIGYASFPVQFSTIKNNDTLVANKIDQYHNHLIKMGIDINSCKCVKCREGIQLGTAKDLNNKSSVNSYKMALIFFIPSLIAFMVWLLDVASCINDTTTCGSGGIALYISLVFFYLSVFYLIKGWLTKIRS